MSQSYVFVLRREFTFSTEQLINMISFLFLELGCATNTHTHSKKRKLFLKKCDSFSMYELRSQCLTITNHVIQQHTTYFYTGNSNGGVINLCRLDLCVCYHSASILFYTIWIFFYAVHRNGPRYLRWGKERKRARTMFKLCRIFFNDVSSGATFEK